jgi:hypothetical protein
MSQRLRVRPDSLEKTSYCKSALSILSSLNGSWTAGPES